MNGLYPENEKTGPEGESAFLCAEVRAEKDRILGRALRNAVQLIEKARVEARRGATRILEDAADRAHDETLRRISEARPIVEKEIHMETSENELRAIAALQAMRGESERRHGS